MNTKLRRWQRSLWLVGTTLVASPATGWAFTAVTTPPATHDTKPVEPAAIRLGLVHGQGLDEPELRRQLALRVPDLELASWTGQEEIDVAPFAVIDVRPVGGSRIHLTVIVSDGRVFHRDVEIVTSPPEREVASELANLIIGIGRHQVRADAEQVPTPTSTPELDGVVGGPGAVDSAPSEDDFVVSTDESRLGVGLTADGGTLLALGPPSYGSALAGGGGALAVSVVWPNRLVVRGSVLLTRRKVSALEVWRVRVGVGAGVLTRWRHGELDASIDASVEPWRARLHSQTATFESDNPSRAVLLGLGAGVFAGWRWSMSTRSVRHIVIGPMVRASGGFAVGSGVGGTAIGVAVRESDGDLDRRLRLGAFELWTGVGLRLWFGR